ncbi:AAA family ATPase [Pseudobutyrivibrio sp.]|uniref:AAA family ATPase n=1 Tax=Pseudobutyrivibrio sp. TaxID=2014367 RepID=UPI00387073D9
MNSKIKIKNFGPIKNGYDQDDGYMSIGKLSVFCGTQGTGKSTLVKLYSTFIWIEKALSRGDIKAEYVEQYNRFVKKYLAYQGINEYVKKETFIHFIGEVFEFIYEYGRLKIHMRAEVSLYQRPQIIYFPAERNLISVIESASGVKAMPGALSSLLEDYNVACRSLSQDLALPVNDAKFHFDKLNKVGSVIGSDYRVRMSEASSGLQSVTPLFVTMCYLSDSVHNGVDIGGNKFSADEKSRIDKRINDILLDDSLDDEMRTTLIKKLSDNKNMRLISIVEEPEQNLYPASQELILYNMIRLSANGDDQLMLTTHSPYILNYLMLSIKAKQVELIVGTNNGNINEIDGIVPASARINGSEVSVYQMDLDGSIRMLEKYDDVPSDDNFLNQLLMSVNTKYSKLVEIQSQYE